MITTARTIHDRLRSIDYINGANDSDELLFTTFSAKQIKGFETLIKIAKEYNVSIDYILGLTEEYYGRF